MEFLRDKRRRKTANNAKFYTFDDHEMKSTDNFQLTYTQKWLGKKNKYEKILI